MAKKVTDDGEVIDEVTHETVARVPTFFKTPFNHDTDAESLSTGLVCKDESKAKQSFLADCDINRILSKFMQTGELPSTGAPQFGETNPEIDLQDRMVTSWDVEQAWEKLPKEARSILGTPQKFVEWYDKCLEEGNVEGLRQVGLIPPEKAPEPPTPPPPGGTPAPEASKEAQPPK